MKRTLLMLAICALCAVATTSPVWADEPTTTITAPVVLPADTITVEVPVVSTAPGSVNTAPVLVNAAQPAVNKADLPANWGPADYARLVALELMPTVVYIVSGLLLALAGVGIYYLRKYTGITVTAQQFSLWQSAADTAWKTVEERLKAGTLKLPDGTPPAGAQKLEQALDVAQGIAQEMGLPKMARDSLAKLIEAKLLEGRG